MTPTPEQIHQRTTYHPPPPAAIKRHQEVRELMTSCMGAFVDVVPEGRELSVALTKLEEAMFWANAGIARNHDKIE